MNAKNNLTIGGGTQSTAEPASGEGTRGPSTRLWVNWGWR